MSHNMRLLALLPLVLLSVSTATSQKTTHKHSPNEKQHVADREEDGSLRSKHHPKVNEDEHDTAFDHEAILGSKQDAEEFDDLPPEEAKRRLKVLLGKMDLNLNERIEKEELHAWIMKTVKSFKAQDNKERFEEADSDINGFMTWEEYKKDEYGDDEERIEQSPWIDEDHYLFNAVDKDRDGSLTLKEFSSFAQPDGDLEIQQHVLQQILNDKDSDKNGFLSLGEFIGDRDRNHVNNWLAAEKEMFSVDLDKNGDGVLSNVEINASIINDKDSDKNGLVNFDEFIEDRERNHVNDWLAAEKERFSRDLDKNGDGVLSKVEIKAWIIPSDYEEIATDEATHLISEADEDKNGELSFEEILDKIDLFAGSEATDYGNHLTNMRRFEEEL